MPVTKIRGNTQIIDGTIYDAQIATAAAIQLTKIQNGSSILLATGTVAMTADFNVGGNNIINVAAPINPNDAANKAYVDAAITGLDLKQSVRVASPGGNVNISAPGATIDGITMTVGDRVLLKDQTIASENGLWEWTGAASAMTRTLDADNNAEVNTGLFVFVEEGSVNGATGWALTTPNPINIGVTNLTFTQFSGSGSYTSGDGLTLVGNQFSAVAADATIVVSPSGIRFRTVTSGDIIVGNASNVATPVTMSGDATITNTGVLAISNNVITPAKLTRQTSGQLLFGQGAGADLAWASMSGDATITNAGLITIGNNVITAAKMARQPTGSIAIGQGAGTDLAWQTVSGDATLSAAGVLTINAGTFLNAHQVKNETPSGTVNGVNVTFVLANTPLSGTLTLYLNGLEQEGGAGNDYTISGATITFTNAPVSGDKVRADYWY
jgi:hypothetical protein